MQKLKLIAGVVVSIAILEVILAFTIPNVVVPFVNTANTTMASSSNMTNYPGTSETLVSAPWVLYLVPPALGIGLIVVELRRQRKN